MSPIGCHAFKVVVLKRSWERRGGRELDTPLVVERLATRPAVHLRIAYRRLVRIRMRRVQLPSQVQNNGRVLNPSRDDLF